MDPKQLVADGYDAMGDAYTAQAVEGRTPDHEWYLDTLSERLQRGTTLLDLGCGAGIPTTMRLAEDFDVTGVDISPGQTARARKNVPNATFVTADIAEVDFPPNSFDAVTAFYSIIHVPREEHYALFQSVVRWLRPGGVFMGSLSASGKGQAASYEGDFFGAHMYWSNYDAIANQRMVAEAGLQIVMADQKTHDFNDETETWLWILAAKPR
jgi:cyclopropane fatty-acyl-phospholipid synthase-like methyltransferase|tara:strand:- start:1043 stop:1675 length:633 start_codon:yes stop_codon:yes gene_type:complete